jgi:hypothetical protein
VLPVEHEEALKPEEALDLTLVAIVESFFLTRGLSQVGQTTSSISSGLRTSSTKSSPHFAQVNSYKGIFFLRCAVYVLLPANLNSGSISLDAIPVQRLQPVGTSPCLPPTAACWPGRSLAAPRIRSALYKMVYNLLRSRGRLLAGHPDKARPEEFPV